MMKVSLFLLLLVYTKTYSPTSAWPSPIPRWNMDRYGMALKQKLNCRWDAILFQSTDGFIEETNRFDGAQHSMVHSTKTVRDISTLSESQALMDDGLHVKPIGMTRSIYRLCVGTPRQGLLAPNARGYIDLFTLGNSSPESSVYGLEDFSHIWVVFVFHLNTHSKDTSRKIKSKVKPPALGGKKVGIYATRTPHRYNPIGMTLCKLDRIEKVDKRNVRLHISGIDLVDGTPVLDIKPYVPVYDSIFGAFNVPSWVEGGLSLRRSVTISWGAQKQLEDILIQNPDALDFFGVAHGEKTIEETMEAILGCIRQVLSTDVRSSYQTGKSRRGGSKAERSSRLKTGCETSNRHCTQQIDNLLVHFDVGEVENPTAIVSENSGAEDKILVTKIQHLVYK